MPLSGKDAVFLLGKYNLTSYLNKVAASHQLDKNDVSVFGNFHSSISGQGKGIYTISGWFDGAVGAYQEALAAYAGGAAVPATLGAPMVAVGDFCSFINGFVDSKLQTANLTSAVALNTAIEGQEGMDYGVWLHVLAAETTTGNMASVDNTASSANGWSANLHVTLVSGTTPSATIKVQDSADNAAWADLASATFTPATAATSQHLSGTGTVRRYVRAVHTITGTTPSFTYALAFGRR